MNLKSRSLLSVIVLGVYAGVNSFLNTTAPIVASSFAGKQFDDSNAAYVISQYGIHLNYGIGVVSTLILIGILWMVWRNQFSKGESK